MHDYHHSDLNCGHRKFCWRCLDSLGLRAWWLQLSGPCLKLCPPGPPPLRCQDICSTGAVLFTGCITGSQLTVMPGWGGEEKQSLHPCVMLTSSPSCLLQTLFTATNPNKEQAKSTFFRTVSLLALVPSVVSPL